MHGLRRQLVAKTAAAAAAATAAASKSKKFRGFAANDKLCGGGREEIQDEHEYAHLRGREKESERETFTLTEEALSLSLIHSLRHTAWRAESEREAAE